MTWLTPALAGIAAAIAIPSLLILYFLKLRRRDLEVSTTLLWKKAIEDLQANAPFQRLRKNILLFLQLLVLGAALLAIGQPQIKGNFSQGSRQVIMIDRSASMSARDGTADANSPKTRLEVAKEEAIKLVESLREVSSLKLTTDEKADEAMLIVFDTTAEVRQQFTSDKNALKNAINSVQPTDGPGLLTEAMQLAKAHAPKRLVEMQAVEGLSDAGSAVTVHLWTDGRLSDADRAGVSPDDKVILHSVGSDQSANIGISSIRAERSFDEVNKLTIFVGMSSTDRKPRNVDVELLIDGRPAAIKAVEMDAAIETVTGEDRKEGELGSAEAKPLTKTVKPSANGAVFQLDRYEGGVAHVRLRTPNLDSPLENDVLDTDDQAWAILPPAKRLSLALVTNGNMFLRLAMEGLPNAKVDVLSVEEFEKRMRASGTLTYDCVVLESYLPPKDLINGSLGLPKGRWLVLGAVPGGESGLIAGSTAGRSKFTEWKRDHPALRQVNLDEPTIGELPVVTVAPGAPVTILAETDRGPGMFFLASLDTRAIVVPWDFNKSDWPYNLSFVIFLASSTRALGDDAAGEGFNGRQLQPNSVLSDRLPGNASDVKFKGPEGDLANLTPSPDASVVYGPIRRSGIYQMTWSGAASGTDEASGTSVSRTYAANLADEFESNIIPVNTLNLRDREVAADLDGKIAADRKLWPWLLLAALLVMLVEWFVYNRKVYV